MLEIPFRAYLHASVSEGRVDVHLLEWFGRSDVDVLSEGVLPNPKHFDAGLNLTSSDNVRTTYRNSVTELLRQDRSKRSALLHFKIAENEKKHTKKNAGIFA